eukprot:TRINITY_DN765_c0_g1_i1.p1 TRINITY_DN765_c0_g1~~TRINITY_DN765_c0_g1_i1.p1  ORF type:complete len:621 (+),score=146.55 TRINITY_DN765_c0_g1_i1:43-1905(+)
MKKKISVPQIDTKGTPIVLPAGGHIIFRCTEVKELKAGHMIYHLKFDDDKAKVWESLATKTEQFPGELQNLDVPKEKKKVTFVFEEKGLLGSSFLGEISFPMSDLWTGYPYDAWYPLKGKGGKDDKKIKGKGHVQIMYLGPDGKAKHDEFKYPLHSLINAKRVDLFEKKISDMGGQVSDVDDKGVTPLLHAAALGAAPFVQLLIEHQASLSEKNPEGRNAIHLAAQHGHTTVLKYLLLQKGADIDAPEQAKTKYTALHLAAENNQGETCALLITAGADIDAKNDKGDTPLVVALLQKNGAPKSVTALIEGKASVYVQNKAGLAPWEVAQKKDLCYSATTRNAFMKACDVIDPREFQIAEKVPQKLRVLGRDLSTDWTTATQFQFTTKKDISEVVALVFSIDRPEDCMKNVGFCVVKDNSSEYEIPSFQPEGIGFGGLEPFRFPMEKDFTYTIVAFSKDESLKGEFGVCLFTADGAPQPTIRESKKWKNTTEVKGEWKGKTAAGSSTIKGNPHFTLTCNSKKAVEVLVMLSQKTGDVSAIVFDDNRITPAKLYVGMYVLNGKKEHYKSERWHNSKDVYIRVQMGGDEPSELTIVPCTRLPEEELEFELSAFSDAKISLKKQ